MHQHPLNGDPQLMAVDRALVELRRGRVVALGAATPDQPPLLIAALETAGATLLTRLRELDRSGLSLAVTAERARALGLGGEGDQPVLLRLNPAIPVEQLATLGRHWEATLWQDALQNALVVSESCNRATAAALLLAKRAWLLPAMLIARPVTLPDSLQVLSVTPEAIERFEAPQPGDLVRVSEARVPLPEAEHSRVVVFRDLRDASEHVAVIIGRPDPAEPVSVRVHSSCLTGDLLGSLRCDCGEQLRSAVARFAAGGGVLLYLTQEGRGIGLANKLRAYQLQDAGLDTVDANEHLGFGVDERSYALAAEMLRSLGIQRIHLLTNNPDKIRELRDAGIEIVEVRPLPGTPNPHNVGYIRTKRERVGHMLPEM
jgi:GTP cyclohydrolase II